MKIHLKGHLKDITNNELTTFETQAIKNKNKLSYCINHEKYIIYMKYPDQLILNRETEEINSTLYFEKEKTKASIYNIKNNDITLEINIKTNHIELSDTTIKISYTVIDSDTEYEYKIEMSE